MFGVDAGTLEQKGSCWKQFWSIWRLCRSGASRRSHVVTFPRRDVGSTIVQVNKRQRRDVSASSVFPALKENGGADLGHREAYERGHRIPEQE